MKRPDQAGAGEADEDVHQGHDSECDTLRVPCRIPTSARLRPLLAVLDVDDRQEGGGHGKSSWRGVGPYGWMAADAGDQAAMALLSVAGYMEQSAADVEAQPGDFWVR
jgi:hypothetical protein